MLGLFILGLGNCWKNQCLGWFRTYIQLFFWQLTYELYLINHYNVFNKWFVSYTYLMQKCLWSNDLWAKPMQCKNVFCEMIAWTNRPSTDCRNMESWFDEDLRGCLRCLVSVHLSVERDYSAKRFRFKSSPSFEINKAIRNGEKIKTKLKKTPFFEAQKILLNRSLSLQNWLHFERRWWWWCYLMWSSCSPVN